MPKNSMNTENTNKQAPPTQRQRWFKYGLNVTVLIIATLAIVVFVNWIAYRRFVRFDFTETRRYSLSQQTTNLLDDLDTDIRITTLYAAGSADPELLRRVEDLLGEYDRRSGRIDVRRIDPTVDIQERDAFLNDLLARYQDEIDRDRRVLEDTKRVLADARAFAERQTGELPGVLAQLSDPDTQSSLQLIQLLRQLNNAFLRIGDNLTESESQIDQALAEDLPNFAEPRAVVTGLLNGLSTGVLTPAIQGFTQSIEDESTPDAVEDALLGMREEYQRLNDAVTDLLERLEEVGGGDYAQLRADIGQSNSIVVTTDRPQATGDGSSGEADEGRGVATLTLNEIYPNLIRAELSRDDVRPEQGYKGEEIVTGAILRLTLDHDTKVVFVNPTPRPVLTPPQNRSQAQQTLSTVAERLEQMNFEVSEWQPAGRSGPGGRAMPPEPKPTADPGETMIFVVLPAPPPNPRQGPNPAGPITASALEEHLESGQPAAVFVAPSQGMAVGSETDPILRPLSEYGIDVDTSRVVLTSISGREGQRQTVNRIELSDWPEGHPVSRAMRGLQGVLFLGLPIDLPAEPPEGVTLWPLVITPEDTWAEAGFFQQQGEAERNESDPAGPFIIAAAAEKDGTRLVTIADQVWASDLVGSLGQPFYVQFPANPELFVNSIYWLGGLDGLIAPGARTQDIRRIESIDRPAMIAVWWVVLLGLPVLCLGFGGAVWLVRRR